MYICNGAEFAEMRQSFSREKYEETYQAFDNGRCRLVLRRGSCSEFG